MEHLSSQAESYSHVVLTDVRDVIFQRDPFPWAASFQPGWVHAFAEEFVEPIYANEHHKQALLRCYGDEALGLFDSVWPTVSPGIIIGTLPDALSYLTEVIDAFSVGVPGCGNELGDTLAVLNVLARTEKRDSFHAWLNKDGIVWTVGADPWRWGARRQSRHPGRRHLCGCAPV